MNDIYIFLLLSFILFCLLGIYFKIANRFNIIDKPNERSSHTLVTVRGGGIIFPLAVFIYAGYFGFNHIYFLSGLMLVSIVSFIDDLQELNGKIRMCFQFITVALFFVEFGLFMSMPIYWILPLIILAVATVNAWNFMDGINGITGGYSLLTVVTLIYINNHIINFGSTSFMISVALSLLVFIFYNFRTNARCFAGDVGSVGIAFIILFLVIQLLLASHNINYILLILVYGLDSATTVAFRIIRRESILEPHRSHLYQYLANEKGLPHTTVSLIYILIQLLVNILIIFLAFKSATIFVISLSIATVMFITVRFAIESSSRLLGKPKISKS
jgi:UDP-N-acetylmuramyl pentapeptide phosphotransferase/UDP-N-acetylglucosamine-1-phosphate transferase